MVLWLEDVQSAVKQVSDEVHDAKVGMSLQSQYLKCLNIDLS